jgi:acetate kinase
LETLGIKMDDSANFALEDRGERCISTPESAVRVLVIPTNEELEIAQQAFAAALEAATGQ